MFQLKYLNKLIFLALAIIFLTLYFFRYKSENPTPTENNFSSSQPQALKKEKAGVQESKYKYVVNYTFNTSFHQEEGAGDKTHFQYVGEITQIKNNANNTHYYFSINTEDDSKNNYPYFFVKNKETKKELYLHAKENGFSGELKRFLVSALQYSLPNDKNTTWKAEEFLNIGKAVVEYNLLENNKANKKISNITHREIVSSDSALVNMTDPHVESWLKFDENKITESYYSVSQRKKSEITGIIFDFHSTAELTLISNKVALEKPNTENYLGLPFREYRNYFKENKNQERKLKPINLVNDYLEKLEYESDDRFFWSVRNDLISAIERDNKFGQRVNNLILESSSDTLKTHLIGALGQTKNEQGQYHLTQLIKNNDSPNNIKQQALMQFSLMESPTEDSFQLLYDLSKSTVPELRSTSILALGKIVETWSSQSDLEKNTDIIEQAADRIYEYYLNAENNTEKSLALSVLGNAGISASQTLIGEALENSNERLRSKAVRALRKDLDPDATNMILTQAENDTSPHVRNTALKTLTLRPIDHDTTQRINQLLQNEPNDKVRITALYTALYANPDKQELIQILDGILSQDVSEEFMQEALKVRDHLLDS